jgi:hypothetical protein
LVKIQGSLYKRTLPPAPSSGWFGFIVNSKGLLEFKAKVLAGCIESRARLLWN